MAKGKASGFLWAVILAAVSFIVIFFFFPDIADRYVGISFKNGGSEVQGLKNAAEEVTSTVKESAVDTAAQAVKNTVNTVSESIGNIDIQSLINGSGK